jgi:hypothetical protein
LKLHRDGDRLLQLLIFNEEFLVSACHQRALITSLPFVHTARRSYRLNGPVRPPDCGNNGGSPPAMLREAVQTLSFRGRRSRNKVSVGEPAEGSLPVFPPALCVPFCPDSWVSCNERLGSGMGELRSIDLGVSSPAPGTPLLSTARASLWPRPCKETNPTKTQLLPMDILALATMKNAAKCDT